MKVLYNPGSEELLRFALEKAQIDILFGMEEINPKDSVHYVRGGLDQVTCTIAAERRKTIGFSFHDIFSSQKRGKLLARMRFNASLCKKYTTKTVFLPIFETQEELRSAQDMQLFSRIVGI